MKYTTVLIKKDGKVKKELDNIRGEIMKTGKKISYEEAIESLIGTKIETKELT